MVSRKKKVLAAGRTVWAYDNAHDVAMAHLVEVAVDYGLPEDIISPWRNASSLRNLAFDYDGTGLMPSVLAQLLRHARVRAELAGDMVPGSLRAWSVLGGCEVSQGVIRGGTLPVQSVLDVIDGLRAMVDGSLAPDPPNARWYLGPRTGRGTISLVS